MAGPKLLVCDRCGSHVRCGTCGSRLVRGLGRWRCEACKRWGPLPKGARLVCTPCGDSEALPAAKVHKPTAPKKPAAEPVPPEVTSALAGADDASFWQSVADACTKRDPGST